MFCDHLCEYHVCLYLSALWVCVSLGGWLLGRWVNLNHTKRLIVLVMLSIRLLWRITGLFISVLFKLVKWIILFFYVLQFDLFVTKVVHTGMKTDEMISSHPLNVPVATPEEALAVFDLISYNKVRRTLVSIKSNLMLVWCFSQMQDFFISYFEWD